MGFTVWLHVVVSCQVVAVLLFFYTFIKSLQDRRPYSADIDRRIVPLKYIRVFSLSSLCILQIFVEVLRVINGEYSQNNPLDVSICFILLVWLSCSFILILKWRSQCTATLLPSVLILCLNVFLMLAIDVIDTLPDYSPPSPGVVPLMLPREIVIRLMLHSLSLLISLGLFMSELVFGQLILTPVENDEDEPLVIKVKDPLKKKKKLEAAAAAAAASE
mmetsp:Transcript_16877/g.30601  ORF Transcript_16877/g.30601 Transcript_16877/m.30601 type:complete len:218 (+) Transcript_16877:533-1186(+)